MTAANGIFSVSGCRYPIQGPVALFRWQLLGRGGGSFSQRHAQIDDLIVERQFRTTFQELATLVGRLRHETGIQIDWLGSRTIECDLRARTEPSTTGLSSIAGRYHTG